MARGWCEKHYQQRRKYGDPTKSFRFRRKPGEIMHFRKNDYIFRKMPDHPNANAKGYIAEHVYVISQFLGRGLFPGEEVHHRNGIRKDNRLENLELWQRKHPPGQRVTDLIKFSLETLRRYADQPQLWNDANENDRRVFTALAKRKQVVESILADFDKSRLV